jgi:transcriptional regulator with XRE-family HTH domain
MVRVAGPGLSDYRWVSPAHHPGLPTAWCGPVGGVGMAEQVALSFGRLLRQLRAEARLTQEDLAEAARLSPRSVSDLERGISRTAHKDTAVLLADALGLAGLTRELFVAAARGRGPAEDVLVAREGGTPGPGHQVGQRAPACPYRGLLPFRESDAEVFYGRERLAAELAAKLTARAAVGGLVVVTGASGSGKSSLLRAGLLPILAQGQQIPGSDRWPRIVMTPTKDPLTELWPSPKKQPPASPWPRPAHRPAARASAPE